MSGNMPKVGFYLPVKYGSGLAVTAALCVYALLRSNMRKGLPVEWLHLLGSYVLAALAVHAGFKLLRYLLRIKPGSVRTCSLNKLLEALATTAEVRDSHTHGHCKRVADNAVLLGKRLGMSESQLDTLYWAALLHDIGKLSVPEYILKKDGRLSDREYLEIKRHPDFGAQLLLNISNHFGDIARVVRCHHERYDGLGYPRQLRGESIPLMSRIISIVDVFEALTSQRTYRQPMPPEEAAAHLLEEASQQFDPDLLALFKESYENEELSCACTPTALEAPSLKLKPALRLAS